ncbi:hypothetical protein ACFQ4O_15240 [Methylopila musalis]|uniref:Uncharacterized protein n=1 Tax=Methylopila musalis TaxID=1134781 RepID=A0ABW3ZBF9_9HYPH
MPPVALALEPRAAVAIVTAVGETLDAMRAHLASNRPASTSEALRLLRDQFPAVPLRLRILACEA